MAAGGFDLEFAAGMPLADWRTTMENYITIALPKGKLFKRSVDLLAKVGYSAEGVSEDSRKLVIANEETKVRFIITKTVDLPTYIEYGAADIGIIGKDVLLEKMPPDDGGAGSKKTAGVEGLRPSACGYQISPLRPGIF